MTTSMVLLQMGGSGAIGGIFDLSNWDIGSSSAVQKVVNVARVMLALAILVRLIYNIGMAVLGGSWDLKIGQLVMYLLFFSAINAWVPIMKAGGFLVVSIANAVPSAGGGGNGSITDELSKISGSSTTSDVAAPTQKPTGVAPNGPGSAPQNSGGEDAGGLIGSWLSQGFNWLINIIAKGLTMMVRIFYLVLRNVLLIFLVTVGPLALAISVFPGFENTWITWLSTWFQTSMWLVTMNILDAILAESLKGVSVGAGGGTDFATSSGLLLLNLAITFMYCMVPTITSYWTGGAGAAGVLTQIPGIKKGMIESVSKPFDAVTQATRKLVPMIEKLGSAGQ